MIPEYKNIDANEEEVMAAINKKISISDYTHKGKLQIRFKKLKQYKRESTMIYRTPPLNIFREETKSSNVRDPNLPAKLDGNSNNSNLFDPNIGEAPVGPS